MIEKDTIMLLRECDAGVKMGISSIDDVLSYVHNDELRQKLTDCRNEHDKLDSKVQYELERFKDEGKEPNPIAKGIASATMPLVAIIPSPLSTKCKDPPNPPQIPDSFPNISSNNFCKFPSRAI